MVKHSAHIVGNINNGQGSHSITFKHFVLSITLVFFLFVILLSSGLVFADNNGNSKDVGNSNRIIPIIALENKAGWNGNNIKQFDKIKDAPRGIVKIKNSYFWIFPTATIEELTLTDNTDTCGQFCFAEKKVTTYVDTALIDSIKFLKLQDDGGWKESSIRNYNFYIKQNLEDEWTLYHYEVMPAGTYYLRLEGEKRPDWTYDWIITSQGLEITEWTVWNSSTQALNVFDDFEDAWINQSIWTNTSSGVTSAAPVESGGKITMTEGGESAYAIVVSNKSGSVSLNDEMVVFVNFTAFSCDSGDCNVETSFGLTDNINSITLSSRTCTSSNNHYSLTPGTYRVKILPDTNKARFYTTVNDYTGAEAYNDISITTLDDTQKWYIWFIVYTHGAHLCGSSSGSIIMDNITYMNSFVSSGTPANNYVAMIPEVVYNCSAIVTGMANLTNISLWTNSTGTYTRNLSTNVTGTMNQTTFRVNYTNREGWKWFCEACDTDGVCGFSSVNRSIRSDFSSVLNSTLSYTLSTYETKHEQFVLNMYWSNDTYPHTDAIFYYNNIQYPTTHPNTSTNLTVFTTNIDIPLVSALQNNTFFWEVNITSSDYVSAYHNVSIYNQTVKPINFSRCHIPASNNRTYLNISFFDEIALTRVNQTMVLSTNFSIGDAAPSTVQRTYNWTNGTQIAFSYAFCFNEPSQNVVLSHFSARYGSLSTYPQYPERTWNTATYALLNNSNNLSLYSLAAGSYVTITVQDMTGTTLTDVHSIITVLIGGVTPYTVGDDYTDTSGQVSFWVNPVVDHSLYLDKAGCISKTISIRPYFSSYTFQLDCGNAGVPLVATYLGQSEGLLYRASPSSGAITGDQFLFQLRVTSVRYNIRAIRIELYATNLTTVASVTKDVDNVTCYPQDCYVNLTYNLSVLNLQRLKGRFLVNLSFVNGTGSETAPGGWYILEADAYWTRWLPSGNGLSSLSNFWTDFRNVFDSWTADEIMNTCNSTSTGPGPDCTNESIAYEMALNRGEFSRVVFIFLILAMLIAALNKFTGYDSANPGSFIGIMAGIFLMGSISGSPSECKPGFFYLSQLFGIDSNYVDGVLVGTCNVERFFMNNYIVAISVIIIWLTYMINVSRRNS